MIQLTDEEIVEALNKGLGFKWADDAEDLTPADREIAKAQLKKVVEWGDEDCPHNPKPTRLKVKRGCIACWQSLLKEVE